MSVERVMLRILIGTLAWATVAVVSIGLVSAYAEPRDIDNSPCFIGMGENLRLCAIYHEDDGRLVLVLQNETTNMWLQFDGDGLVETWFDRGDIGNAKRAVAWRFDATDAVPFPGKGISTTPGFVAVRITGRLLEPSGIEDIVTVQP